jgi:hypothetical protein
MTHDELLAKLLISDETKLYETLTQWQKVLYAVLEVHTPIEGHEHLCGGCWFGDGMMAYPCPTIQAIEKELK